MHKDILICTENGAKDKLISKHVSDKDLKEGKFIRKHVTTLHNVLNVRKRVHCDWTVESRESYWAERPCCEGISSMIHEDSVL